MCEVTETVDYTGMLPFVCARYKAKIRTFSNIISLVISCGCTKWSVSHNKAVGELLMGNIWDREERKLHCLGDEMGGSCSTH
jgi:hypothetical protein